MTGVPTRILVGVTLDAGSDEAVAVASALAAALGAEMVLVVPTHRSLASSTRAEAR